MTHRRILLTLLCTLLLASLCALPDASAQRATGGAVPGELLVKFRPQTSAAQRAASLAVFGAEVIRHYDVLDIDHLRVPTGGDLKSALSAFQANPDLLFVQPNYIRHVIANSPPNDSYWLSDSLWGMLKIQAQPVWQALLAPGNDSVVVASIDTGVDYNHPDLAANMWHNPGEIPGNGIDDDGNGYIDDVYGIDTVNHDSDPMDDHGHGTHTSGTMAAVGNNGIGVVGVHWKAKIIACKFISAADEGTDADAIECFNYLIALKQRGVNIRVTNNSWGETRDLTKPFPAALQAAFDAAGEAGILNFCAAGNETRDNDQVPADPATFTSPSIVSVAASEQNDYRTWFTNWGAVSVDLAAPGLDTLSTRNSTYSYLSGTSMSSPHAAGSAALIAELHPAFSALALKSLLLDNVDVLPQWSGLSVSGGRLNLARAAEAAALAETTLRITSVARASTNTFRITWTSVPGAGYRVSHAANASSPFFALSGVIMAGPGETSESYTDTTATAPQQVYKVELVR